MGFLGDNQGSQTVDAAGVPTIMPAPSSNVLADVARGPLPAVAPAVTAPRSRQSIVDIVGRLADVGATIGGTPALYQSGRDAMLHRSQAEEDRKVQQQLQQQQIAKNNQAFESGALEIDDKHLAQVGQATRGLKAVLEKGGPEAVKRAWPLMAQQLKIPDDQKAAFSASLAEDPEYAITAMSAALDPTSNASQARELQLYAVAKKENPSLKFTDFLNDLKTNPMNPYQEASLGIQRERLQQTGALGQGRLDLAREQARARAAAAAAKNGGGGGDMTALSGVLSNVRKNYQDLDAAGGLTHQGGSITENLPAWAKSTGLGQMVGRATGSKAQTYIDNITNSRPAIIQAIKQATGMTSKQLDSNADMKLALQQATDPNQSRESNNAALDRLEAMVRAHNATKPAAPAPRRAAPPPRSGGGRVLRYNPATGKIE